MHISYSTLREWKGKYSAISAALKSGKEYADVQVENALFKRAVGFQYVEEKTETDEHGRVRTTKINRTALPDTVAQIYWLKNRRPDVWRDRPNVDANADSLEKLDKLIEGITDAAKR